MTYDLNLMRQELIRDEGARLKPYRDTMDKLTIGIGRNLDDIGISEEEAEFLLTNDIARTAAALDDALSWWRDLDDVRQRVILNMAFNMGVSTLLQFHNTLACAQSGDYAGAARNMLASRWAVQVGDRAIRLANMMEKGV